MSIADFIAEALPLAREGSVGTGVRVSVIVAQWIDETWDPDTQSPGPDWTVRHNPGNVSPGGVEGSYDTLEDGLAAWIATMNGPIYRPVRAAPTAAAQAMALGASPWAQSHYMAAHGPPPGSDLLQLMATYDLEQYDAAPGPPAPPEDAPMVIDPEAKVIHAVAVVNGVPYHWWQPAAGNTTIHFPPGVAWGVEKLPLPQ
jgi:hypothetical protein